MSEEIAVRFIAANSRTIARFAYEDANRTPVAFHCDGTITLCSDVPAAMCHVLQKTPTPEAFFFAYLSPQFPKAIASARISREACR